MISGCSTYESVYQDPPLTIDGSSSDWNTTLDSETSGVSCGISNDTNNVYIRIIVSDIDIQRKILMTGLTFWIDTTGKKKKTLGITCPIQKAPARIDRRAMKGLNGPPEFNKNQILEGEFIGFKKSIETYYIDNNPYNIKVSIDVDEFRSMYYEMQIPLSTIYKKYNDISLKSLSIGFETGAIEIPNNNQMSTNMASAGGKGSGARSGGRGGGGRSGGTKGGRSEGPSQGSSSQPSLTNLTSPTKFWVKNILLAHP